MIRENRRCNVCTENADRVFPLPCCKGKRICARCFLDLRGEPKLCPYCRAAVHCEMKTPPPRVVSRTCNWTLCGAACGHATYWTAMAATSAYAIYAFVDIGAATWFLADAITALVAAGFLVAVDLFCFFYEYDDNHSHEDCRVEVKLPALLCWPKAYIGAPFALYPVLALSVGNPGNRNTFGTFGFCAGLAAAAFALHLIFLFCVYLVAPVCRRCVVVEEVDRDPEMAGILVSE